MKVLKYIILLIIIILAGGAAYISLIDGHYELEEHMELKAPRELVFKQVENLKKWENWSSLQQYTSANKYSTKTLGTKAFVEWKIEDFDLSGKIVNESVTRNSAIVQSAYTEKSLGKTTYTIKWKFTSQADTTSINLHILGKQDFWAKALQLFQNSKPTTLLSKEATHSLARLNETIQQKMAEFSIHIDGLKTTQKQAYVFNSLATTNEPDQLAQKRQKQVTELKNYLQAHQLEPEGDAFMLFNKIDSDHHNVIVSIALPISTEFTSTDNTSQNVMQSSLPAQQAIKGTLKGDYINTPKLWEAAKVYMQRNQLTQDDQSPAYEVYLRTQEDTKNPAQWITELYIPIKKEPEKNIAQQLSKKIEESESKIDSIKKPKQPKIELKESVSEIDSAKKSKSPKNKSEKTESVIDTTESPTPTKENSVFKKDSVQQKINSERSKKDSTKTSINL